MYDLLIQNALLADNTETDIFIEDGFITKIEKDIPPGRSDVLDAKGTYILPGLIDMNCRCCDPGYENKEDFISASKSAVKGGFTSITCQPGTKPVADNKTVIHYIITKSRREAFTHIFPYGSMTQSGLGENMAEIGEMLSAGIVAVSNADSLPENAALLRNVLHYTRMHNIPVITACHDPSLAAGGVMNLGEVSNKLGLAGIPREAEESVVARNIILARYSGARLHIGPISTGGSVDLIRKAKKEGLRITCGTDAHYFTLTEEDVDGYNNLAKTMPPLRTQADADCIIEGIKDGTIDIIASGHRPDTHDRISLEFDQASFAISTLETSFPSAYTALVKTGMIPFARLMQCMSENPAEILSLPLKGGIKTGYEADLFLMDPMKPHVVNPLHFASKAKYSPYNGHEMACTVTATIINGRIVYLRND